MKKVSLIISLLLIVFAGICQSVDGPLKTLTTTGTSTAYTITEPLPGDYNTKERFIIRFHTSCGDNPTLNRAGLGAKNLKFAGNVAIASGDLKADAYLVSYEPGGYYQVHGAAGGGSSGSAGGDLTGTYPNPTVKTSIALTGNPTAPTQTPGTANTTIANTDFVMALTTLTAGNVPVGNASNVATGVALGGDIASVSNTGSVTFANTAVTPGSYTNTNLTVDGKGRITAASNGSGGGWSLSGPVTNTMTGGLITNASTQPVAYLWNGTVSPTTANNQIYNSWAPVVTTRATAADTYTVMALGEGTLTAGAASQTLKLLNINANNMAATNTPTRYPFFVDGVNGDFFIDQTGSVTSQRPVNFGGGISPTSTTLDLAVAVNNTRSHWNMGTHLQTSAFAEGFRISTTFAPVSGSTTVGTLNLTHTVNQTGSANGAVINHVMSLTPTAMVGNYTWMDYTSSSGITLSNTMYWQRYRPTHTSVTTPYGIVIEPTGVRNGFGVATPTAKVHIEAGTTAASSGPVKLTEGVNPTSAEDGLINYVSNNITFTETTTVYTLAKTLTATATLDFGSTAGGAATDLTITVTGAADGDPCVVGPVNASVPNNGSFSCWVSATNTVTVRFANNDLVAAKDPASGTFRASVLHY